MDYQKIRDYLDKLDNNIIASRNHVANESISKMFSMEYKEIVSTLNYFHEGFEKNCAIEDYENFIHNLDRNYHYLMRVYENFLIENHHDKIFNNFQKIIEKEKLNKIIQNNHLQLKKSKI
jgi:hypothetical protein